MNIHEVAKRLRKLGIPGNEKKPPLIIDGTTIGGATYPRKFVIEWMENGMPNSLCIYAHCNHQNREKFELMATALIVSPSYANQAFYFPK